MIADVQVILFFCTRARFSVFTSIAVDVVFLVAVELEDTVTTLVSQDGVGLEYFFPCFLFRRRKQPSSKACQARAFEIPDPFLFPSFPEATLLQEIVCRLVRAFQDAFDIQTQQEHQELQKQVESRNHHCHRYEEILEKIRLESIHSPSPSFLFLLPLLSLLLYFPPS